MVREAESANLLLKIYSNLIVTRYMDFIKNINNIVINEILKETIYHALAGVD